MWPGVGRNIWDDNTANCGLAVAWGLTHVDLIKGPEQEPEPGETRRQMEARQRAAREAKHLSEQVERSLHLAFDNSAGLALRDVPWSDAGKQAAFRVWRDGGGRLGPSASPRRSE